MQPAIYSENAMKGGGGKACFLKSPHLILRR